MKIIENIDLAHVMINESDYTLCGYGTDDIDFTDLKDKRIKNMRKWKQYKIEYGSNCKECISQLRRLKKIKY